MAIRYEYHNEGDNTHYHVGGVAWKCQTFTPLITHNVEFVKVKVYKTDSEEGYWQYLRARIERCDEDGKPNGECLCYGSIEANLAEVTTDPAGEWKTILLDHIEIDNLLTAGTKYALVLDCQVVYI